VLPAGEGKREKKSVKKGGKGKGKWRGGLGYTNEKERGVVL